MMEVAGNYISPGLLITVGPIAFGLAIALVLTLTGAWKEK